MMKVFASILLLISDPVFEFNHQQNSDKKGFQFKSSSHELLSGNMWENDFTLRMRKMTAIFSGDGKTRCPVVSVRGTFCFSTGPTTVIIDADDEKRMIEIGEGEEMMCVLTSAISFCERTL